MSKEPCVEKSVGEHSLGENSVGEKAIAEKPVGEKSVGDKPAGEESVGERSVGDGSLREKTVGGKFVGQMFVGEKSEKSVGEGSPGEKSVSETYVVRLARIIRSEWMLVFVPFRFFISGNEISCHITINAAHFGFFHQNQGIPKFDYGIPFHRFLDRTQSNNPGHTAVSGAGKFEERHKKGFGTNAEHEKYHVSGG